MTGQSNGEKKSLFERLPQTVVPTHYDVTIQPHLDTFKFNGDVQIRLQVKEATNRLVLYAAELEIGEAKIKAESIDELNGNVEYDKEGERITVNLDQKLDKGEYDLSLTFVGEINNRMRGFYRTKYTTPDGNETRYGASTQFEPADCRQAFPCWDEPNFKATFDITLITPKDLRAISNMPIKSENVFEKNEDWKVTKFERTPIMSTYLVAYVVGEYDFVETTDSYGVSMKVYTPVGKKEHGQFALDTAAKILPFYADYFNIKYPIAKADQIAIADFAMGAMENWGLITYRETALLIDPKFSSMDTRQRVAIVVAHELAHQWFGNLVTMDWWTDLWLNEGFATWIEYLAVDKCYPEFDIWTQFVADTFARFLVPDALKSSHPIEVPIGHPAEIDEIFDAISYSKGSSVIRMLHDYIGDDAFRQGLHNYLTEFSYKNTVTENLWSHLAKASNKPVNEVMSSWTLQMGYPLLTVSEEKSGEKRTIKIQQQRFIADGSVDEENLQWKIPITIFTKSDSKKIAKQILMEEPELTLTLENVGEDDWIKLNFNSIGLYRVKYESETLGRLNEPIANKTISPQDRLMIQNDVAALCNAAHQSFVDYLKLLPSYKDEDNFTVWKSIAANINDLSSLLEYTGHKYVDFDVFHTDSMEESSNKTEGDFETSHMIPNSRLTSADHPVLIRLENEYQARRSFWLRRSGQYLLYPGEADGRGSSCNDQGSLTNEGTALKKPDKQLKHFVLQDKEKLETPQGLKRQRKPETELTSSWWREKESSLQVTEGDRIFAQKCRELQGFIKPLTNLLNGLKRGRYERGLSSFQQSVAMDRIQRIVGVLQKPEMGERYLGTLLQVEMMLKVWFPDVASSHSSFSSSSSDYDMEEPRYKMSKPPDVSSPEKSRVLRSSRESMPSPPDHAAPAPLHSDCACCRERAQVLAQWPNMNMTWMHTAPICNPPLSQADLHHLNRAVGQDLFGPNAPSCGVIFFVQNSQPLSPVHPITVAEVEKPISPLTSLQENPEELSVRCQSAPALAQHGGTQSLDASKPHSHSLPLLPARRPDGENT